MKKIYFIIVLLFFSKSIYAQNGYLGEVRLFAGDFAPQYWAKCEGQLLQINTNIALFQILGAMYGGDGVRTFALPDYRGRTAVGPSAQQGTTPGKQQGEDNAVLLPTNIPAHLHTANIQANTYEASQHVPTTSSVIAAPTITVNSITYPVVAFNPYVPYTNLALTTTGTAGKNLPINVNQPSLGLTYIICIVGYYPSAN